MAPKSVQLGLSLVALVIGAIGAGGQGYLLYHELVNTYPYKIIDFEFYSSIARLGVWLAPLSAVFVGAVFLRRTFWVSLLLPVVISPIVFAGIYGISTFLHDVPGISANETGEFTTASATAQFYSYCLSLASAGLIIGGVAGLWLLVARRRLS